MSFPGFNEVRNTCLELLVVVLYQSNFANYAPQTFSCADFARKLFHREWFTLQVSAAVLSLHSDPKGGFRQDSSPPEYGCCESSAVHSRNHQALSVSNFPQYLLSVMVTLHNPNNFPELRPDRCYTLSHIPRANEDSRLRIEPTPAAMPDRYLNHFAIPPRYFSVLFKYL